MRWRGRGRPASARVSATAEPRPPVVEWFSAVSTVVVAVAAARTVAVSRGLMTGILRTTVAIPAERRTRAALGLRPAYGAAPAGGFGTAAGYAAACGDGAALGLRAARGFGAALGLCAARADTTAAGAAAAHGGRA